MLKDFSFDASSFVSRLFSEATSENEEPVGTRTSSTTPSPKLTHASPTPLPLFSPIHPKSREIQPRVELLYDQIEVECWTRKWKLSKLFMFAGVSHVSRWFRLHHRPWGHDAQRQHGVWVHCSVHQATQAKRKIKAPGKKRGNKNWKCPTLSIGQISGGIVHPTKSVASIWKSANLSGHHTWKAERQRGKWKRSTSLGES